MPKRMTKEEREMLGYELRSYRNDYESDFKNSKRKDYAFIIETNRKHIQASLNQERFDAYADHMVGQIGDSTDYMHHSVAEERTTDAEFASDMNSIHEKAKNQLICLYLATKEAMEHRSKLSKFFHPFRTRQENKSFEKIKDTMKELGINSVDAKEVDEMTDVKNSLLPSEERELERQRANNQTRVPIDVDLGEREAESEPMPEIKSISKNLEKENVNEI